jgi:hypothetical protein
MRSLSKVRSSSATRSSRSDISARRTRTLAVAGGGCMLGGFHGGGDVGARGRTRPAISTRDSSSGGRRGAVFSARVFMRCAMSSAFIPASALCLVHRRPCAKLRALCFPAFFARGHPFPQLLHLSGAMTRLVIVVEKASDWGSYYPSVDVVSAMDYLREPVGRRRRTHARHQSLPQLQIPGHRLLRVAAGRSARGTR